MSKISHLLEIIITLQYKKLITASELADVLNVDKKTIYRYVDSLNKANIPICTKKGRYGGFYIDSEFYMKSPNLTVEELDAILMAEEILSNESSFFYKRELRSAVGKIKSACFNNCTDFDHMKRSYDFHTIKFDGIKNLENNINKINCSMSRGRTIKIKYISSAKNEIIPKLVDAYNVIYRNGFWELIGYDHEEDGVKSFKIFRIKDVDIINEIYFRPRTFNLKEYLKNCTEGKKPVKIKFNKNVAGIIKEKRFCTNNEIENCDDGGVILKLYVEDLGEIKNWIISFGANAEVIEPNFLKDEVRKNAEEILNIYS